MDNINYTTEHRKGQHLLSEERHEISTSEGRLVDLSNCEAFGTSVQYHQKRSEARNSPFIQWEAKTV